MISKFTTSTLLFFLSFCITLHAERAARLIYLNAPAQASKEMSILQEKEDPLTLKILTKNFSTPFQIAPAGKRLIIAPKGTMKDEDGEWKKFPAINISEDWSKIVIFLTEDKTNERFPVRGFAVNASSANFGEGDFMFINLSDAQVVGKAGDKEIKIQPRKRLIVRRPLKKKGSAHISLDMKLPEQVRILRLARQSFSYTGKARSIFFIVPGRGGQPPKMQLTNLASFKVPR